MYLAKRWNLLNTTFLTGTLALALVLVPWRLATAGLRWSEALVCLAMVFAIGTAISGGYHRLFSHRAYKASWPVRFLFLCLGAAAFENSALKWASDHRLHHQHVDTDQDPYTIGKGFWYAHWTWVMEAKDHPLVGVADLEKDPLVRWQHRHHFLIGAVVATIPLWIGLGTGNVLGHLVFGLALRIVLTHHTTFFINSAAHWFGSRPYTDANTARDNWLLAPLTYGEGYHNFHHQWQWGLPQRGPLVSVGHHQVAAEPAGLDGAGGPVPARVRGGHDPGAAPHGGEAAPRAAGPRQPRQRPPHAGPPRHRPAEVGCGPGLAARAA